ncbi:GNAT family N-acetyltransferase [Mucilaginibacter glaciei]|uniref:GNAT family N-acetyltransferase n=1 Tax=Mucilaginibacter glaciei TaxID=2772109 RepID=A0A926NHW3_9SPHI|nr:GNAT family N-acetyltransferase [Mucilaginibacter glaciei]MBD1392384.1 GNAT family N-acetyltransferase [Mucilaginibacter glaciei]
MSLQIEQIRPELTWQLRRDILYPEQTNQEMAMDEDNHGYHFAAFKDNYIVAVVSVFQNGTDWQFRKFAVSDKVQGQGIGRQLLDYITGFVELEQGTHLWCNARLSATGFYAKFGFKEAGEMFRKNGVDYIIMEKDLPSK